jgi:hypothetical protein
MTLADETAKLRSRRSLLTAAAAGAAAAAAATIAPASVAAASTTMMTETNNTTVATTSISDSSASSTAFVANATSATAVEGNSDNGIGVQGASADTSDPAGYTRNAGVVGVAGSPSSIADNIGLSGVYGYADASTLDGYVGSGVWGDSADIGVVGTGSIGVQGIGGWGVEGYTQDTNGVGVRAVGSGSTTEALQVVGRAEFSRSGRVTMSSGTSSKKVTLAGCTSSTLIIALMASDRSGRWVRAVVPTTGSFTIYLNGTLTSAAYVAWIAFTNPSNHAG